MFTKIAQFIKGLFLDDVDQPCIGRFTLFIGLMLTPFTAVWSMDTPGDIGAWEAAVRCSPGIIGLIAYIFTRLAEMKEWIAEQARNFIPGDKDAKVQKTV